MDCQRARLLLLQSDDPRPARCGPPELAEHLRRCASCRRLAGRTAQLEEAYRSQPEPVRAEPARLAFLKKLERHPTVAARRAARSWRTVSIRWAAAAVLLLAVGMGALMLLPAPSVQAAPDLVERLVDWNLEIAQATTPDERQRIHTERAETLTRSMGTAALTPEDRRLAARLLETGGRLAKENDPLAEVDHLDAMTDFLVDHLQIATDRGNNLRVNHLAKQLHRVAEGGLAPKLDRVAAAGPGQGERLARLAEREAQRLNKLEKMVQKAPKATQKELKKAVDGAKKQQKKPHKAKG